MNNEGAIFVLKTLRDMHLGMANDDALTMAIAALEKQEPMKVKNQELFKGVPSGDCPACGDSVIRVFDGGKHCNNCGQALSWEEDAE